MHSRGARTRIVGLTTLPSVDSQDSKGSARPKALILRAKMSIPRGREELERQLDFDILLSSLSSACLLPSLQHSTQLNTMSGRGKGGKGLGKGGAKRHRKVLRDNIQVRSATLPIMSCCCASTKLMHCSVLTALVPLCHLFTGVLWRDAVVMHAPCCCLHACQPRLTAELLTMPLPASLTGHHQARHPASCPPWRCQAYQRPHL